MLTLHSGCSFIQILQAFLIIDKLLDAFAQLSLEFLDSVDSLMNFVDFP